MADRIFAVAVLAFAAAYGAVAWGLEAPFAYDPLGPSTWPKILAGVLVLSAAGVLLRPDPNPSWGGAGTLGRVALMVAALSAYAVLFEPLGFVVSTTLYCTGTALAFRARVVPAAVFGVAFGLVGYEVGTQLLALNLPAGILPI